MIRRATSSRFSAVGGIPEIVRDGETGILVPPRDPAALARAVLDLLGDPERGARLNRAGRELVRKSYCVEAMVEGTLSVYRRVLGERS